MNNGRNELLYEYLKCSEIPIDLQLSIAHNFGLSKAIKTTQIAILPIKAKLTESGPPTFPKFS